MCMSMLADQYYTYMLKNTTKILKSDFPQNDLLQGWCNSGGIMGSSEPTGPGDFTL